MRKKTAAAWPAYQSFCNGCGWSMVSSGGYGENIELKISLWRKLQPAIMTQNSWQNSESWRRGGMKSNGGSALESESWAAAKAASWLRQSAAWRKAHRRESGVMKISLIMSAINTMCQLNGNHRRINGINIIWRQSASLGVSSCNGYLNENIIQPMAVIM